MNILFQGDSITDAGRVKDTFIGTSLEMGCGYANQVTAYLSYHQPDKYCFYNRGISGNKVTDVYCRIKRDCWELKPDIISLLVGVNDIYQEFVIKNGVEINRFKRIYEMFISDTLDVLPKVKFILLEPFILNGSVIKDFYEEFRSKIFFYAEAIRQIAEKYGAQFVPLQNLFDLKAKGSPQNWLIDGIHPTPAGHYLIAQQWLEAFNKLAISK